jgi:hypothetical protein
MKALSLWQPWASAMAVGAKRYETRSWAAPRTVIGARMAIHAAKRRHTEDRECFEDILDECHESRAMFEAFLDLSYDSLPRGVVLCTGILKACHRVEDLQVSAIERWWGNYSAGRFAWEFTDITVLAQPVPFIGRQGIFEVE